MTPARPQQSSQAGFTLMEVLIALALLGAGIMTVVAALQFGFESTLAQRELANAELALRAYAESVKQEPYSPVDRIYGGGFDGGEVQVEVVEVLCWNGGLSPQTPYVACGPGDTGAQLVRVRAFGPFGTSIETQVVKRP